MVDYILPTASLLLTFLSTLACLRFLFSRQFFFWLFPFCVSLLLCINNVFNLLSPQSPFIVGLSGNQLVLLLLSFFWYMIVIIFHYALKKVVGKNRFRNDMRKNYNEAKFLEKNERRDFFRFSKKKKEVAINGAYVPTLSEVHNLDLTVFD